MRLRLTIAQARAVRAAFDAPEFVERVRAAVERYLAGIAADKAAGSPVESREALRALDDALARVARIGKAREALRVGDQLAGGDGADLVARMRAALATPAGVRPAYREGPRLDVHARVLGFNLARIVDDFAEGSPDVLRATDAAVCRILEEHGHKPAPTPHRLGRTRRAK